MLSGLFMSHCSAFDDPDEEAEQNPVWVLFTSGSGFCCAAVLYDFGVLGPSPHYKRGPQGSIWKIETTCFTNAKHPLYPCLLCRWPQRHYVKNNLTLNGGVGLRIHCQIQRTSWVINLQSWLNVFRERVKVRAVPQTVTRRDCKLAIPYVGAS